MRLHDIGRPARPGTIYATMHSPDACPSPTGCVSRIYHHTCFSRDNIRVYFCTCNKHDCYHFVARTHGRHTYFVRTPDNDSMLCPLCRHPRPQHA